uniref:Lipase-like C-terminal domain-containing protein n=1 Tax=Cafeteria roenbergensis TaxID=33653 RepID=A0A7S0PEA1_CAFRO|mmetsp:Transcript_22788/g.86326  ORF Transcript_22788/g.86326 Transcript_22788/m.86326 type:complete len:642 (+) Transcript_22788:142-2067(+)
MSGPAPTRLQEPKASLGFPVVCIPGFLAPSTGLRRYWGALTGEIDDEQHRARCLCPAVSGVGSVHERACQVFYALVGGRVDYGEAHAARHGCERFGATIPSRSALHPEWSAQRPVHLIGHSFGGQTARMLIQLLHERAFASHPNTSAEWVASCVAVSAPLCGALATSTLGADPAVLAQWDAEQRGAASRGLSAPPAASESRSPGQATAPEGAAAATAAKAALQSAQWSDASVPYVRWFSAGHLLGAAVHAAEWADLDALRGLGLDFQLTHLGLARSAAGVVGGFVDIVRGLIPGGRSRLYQTTNCAPFDLSVHGAARLNRRTTAQPGVMFASVVGMGAGKGLSRERDVATAAVAAETGGSAVSRQSSNAPPPGPTPAAWGLEWASGLLHAVVALPATCLRCASGAARAGAAAGDAGAARGSGAARAPGASRLAALPGATSPRRSDTTDCWSASSPTPTDGSVPRHGAAAQGRATVGVCSTASAGQSGTSLPASALLAGKAWLLTLLRSATHATEWTDSHFATAVPGFSAKRWLQGGHDGLASEFTQTAPLVYDADGGACRHAPVREGLPRAGEAAELGVWHVLRVESDHLGIVPSPCDGELARSVLEQVVGALAASERARASLRADAATGSNRVACGSSGL